MDLATDQASGPAEVVLACDELEQTLDFFTDRLGFAVDQIMPADKPNRAVLIGHGVRLRLDTKRATPDMSCLRVYVPPGATECSLLAPNGTRIECVQAERPVPLPALDPAFLHTRMADPAWSSGRAGMRYRDLIPGRFDGRFVASHIVIDEAGPVPDYVHFHRVRMQFIYCWKGWAKLVYEDQGEPFLLREGDCVLQPPTIRHRVLESSGPLEVIEFGSPAEHPTHADTEMALPNATVNRSRRFEGQQFVRFQQRQVDWKSEGALRFKDTGIETASNGTVSVRVLELASGRFEVEHQGELVFLVVLDGAGSLSDGADPQPLSSGDALSLPAGRRFVVESDQRPIKMLEVRVPAS